MLTGIYPVGQILNYDDRRYYQGRGRQHFHVPIHVENSAQIDEDDDEVVT